MRQLIIHADDFGLSERVNEGIVEAFLRGNLTSTSVIANGRAFGQAIKMCRSLPALDIGIHLTLVAEKPLLSGRAVKTLVNSHGNLHNHAWHFTQKYLCGLISLQEVRLELDAQIQKILNTDLEISHMDSHQHLHMLPGIFSIIADLAKKYHIPCIRLPHEKFHPAMLREWRLLPRIVQMLVLGFFCRLARDDDFRRTDRFFGFLCSGNLNKKNLLKILKILPQRGTCEIMCHPGQEGPDSSYNHWRYHWQDELDALLDPEVTDTLARENISLIAYRDLPRRGAAR